MPQDLLQVIEWAQTIGTWQENLTRDEVPPEWMWTVDHELEIWFERVDAEREERYGTGSSKTSNRDEASMMNNELLVERRAPRG